MSYRDPEIDPSLRREREEQERDAELARRIRQEVRRIRSGEAEADNEEDGRIEAEQQARKVCKERRSNRALRQFFTGSILTRREVRHLYPYVACVGVMMLFSIFMLFHTLRLDIRRSRLESEVHLLHERQVRLSQEVYRATSRTHILRRLGERGILLEEAPDRKRVVETD